MTMVRRSHRLKLKRDAKEKDAKRSRLSSLSTRPSMKRKRIRGTSGVKNAPRRREACPHTSSIDLDKVIKILRMPMNWMCVQCSNTNDAWICLGCGMVGCGRKHESHALSHYRKTRHPLVLSVSSKAYYCYACEQWVIGDNVRGELDLLRKTLISVQKDNFDSTTTRSGRRIGNRQSLYDLVVSFGHKNLPFVRKNSLRENRLDMVYTAKTVARNNTMIRTFARWKTVWANRRRRSDMSSTITTVMGTKAKTGETSKRRKRRRDSNANCTRLPGRVGLRNLGNSCYLNSVLQAMSNTLPIRDLILSQTCRGIVTNDGENEGDSVLLVLPTTRRTSSATSSTDDLLSPPVLRRLTTDIIRAHAESPTYRKKMRSKKEETVSLFAELYSLLRILWTKKRGRKAVLTPHAMFYAVWRFIPRFRSYEQQDAHEFFIDLMDALENENTTKQSISKLCSFSHTSVVTCRRCGRESTCESVSVCLSISLFADVGGEQNHGRGRRSQGRSRNGCGTISESSRRRTRKTRPRGGKNSTTNLVDCIRAMMRPEVLANAEKVYYCERCQSKQSATKRWELMSTPEVLVIHVRSRANEFVSSHDSYLI